MVGVLLADILYAKIVNDEAKENGSPLVVPQTRRRGALEVPLVSKMLAELYVGKNAGLWQAVNTLCDIEVDPAILGERMQVVFFNEFLRYAGDLDSDILGPVHGGAKIKKFTAKASKTRAAAQEDTVDYKFDKFK